MSRGLLFLFFQVLLWIISPSIVFANTFSSDRALEQIRNDAMSYGGDCQVEQTAMSRHISNLRYKIDRYQVKVGENISIDWWGNNPSNQLPIYFMITTNQPVRFKGEGFYALQPNAIAPFGISTQQNKTRSVVALYGRQKARGRIQIEPLLAGSLEVQTAVVGYVRRCKVQFGGSGKIEQIIVSPSSNASFLVDQQFYNEPGTKYYKNKTGDRILAVNDRKVRLLSSDGQRVILQTDGEKPVFSPTGRYLTIDHSGTSNTYDVIDGAILFTTSSLHNAHSIAWVNNDSFSYIAEGRYGHVAVAQPLIIDRPYLASKSSYSCHGCSGLSTSIKIDLEADMVLVHGDFQDDYDRLSTRTEKNENEAFYWNQETLISKSGILRLKIPKGWESINPLEFSYFIGVNHLTLQKLKNGFAEYANTKQQELNAKLSVPNEVARQNLPVFNAVSGATIARSLNWRTRALDPIGDVSNTITFWEQLAGLGLPTIGTIVPNFDSEKFLKNSTNRKKLEEWDLEKDLASHILSRMRDHRSSRTGRLTFPKDIEDKSPCSSIGDESHMAFDYAYEFEFGKKTIWVFYHDCDQGTGLFDFSLHLLIDSDQPEKRIIPDTRAPDERGDNGCGHLAQCEHRVSFSQNGFLFFFSQVSKALAVYDLTHHRTILKIYDLKGGAAVSDVRLAANGRHIVQRNEDGTFYVYRITDGKKVLNGRYVDNEMVVWTDDLRFDATAEGALFTNFKFPGIEGQFTFQQFEQTLKVPGLVTKVLNKQLSKKAINLGIPPNITANISNVTDRKFSINFIARDDERIKKIVVYQDGLESHHVTNVVNGQKTKIDIDRVPGSRWASIAAIDNRGLQSLPIGRDLGPSKTLLPRVHLIAIGVDYYSDTKISNLNYARTDAFKLYEAMEKLSKASINLASSNLFLQDEDTTPQQILDKTQKVISQMKQGDSLVFFFAGHGVRDKHNRFYLATTNSRVGRFDKTSLPWDDVAKLFAKSKGKITVLLDACHSGAVGTTFFARNDDAAAILTRQVPSGLTILSAAKGRQYSIESPSVEGGLFTHAIAQVVEESRTEFDVNSNGAIEISELFTGVRNVVRQISGGKQSPWLVRNQMIGDFALF